MFILSESMFSVPLTVTVVFCWVFTIGMFGCIVVVLHCMRYVPTLFSVRSMFCVAVPSVFCVCSVVLV